MRLDNVDDAIADIAVGKPVIVVDDEDRENEGDMIIAADLVTPESLAFMVRYSSGYICVGMTDEDADRCDLPPMVTRNQDKKGTAYTVTVDSTEGCTTGISATDRAHTIRLLASPRSMPHDFTRPGHVVPLRARAGGVLVRAGHTEAAVDLARLAQRHPAGALCEIVSEENPTTMARGPELRRFADEHSLRMISIDQLIAYRRSTERLVERIVETALPTTYGQFTAIGYRNVIDGLEHVALVVGDPSDNEGKDVLVRVHSECLTGDVFGSRRCDCGDQLHHAMKDVYKEGRGVVLYMRGHEGRGIGLISKLEAYKLQDDGYDTVDANIELGKPADAREYGTGSAILSDLGVQSMILLSNNPTKHAGLKGHGLTISGRRSIEVGVYPENLNYLRTKRDKMGHNLPSLSAWEAAHTAGHQS
ncbi:bifunctional 3,4-dihydroxy-2-butanone-4-phosphate synthase/GTP cyclohydrolase II [Corynebacterium kroppenstedtii]|uniref:bifunctional 3,4-dihydroxy-2-butanone-4-phosphate synthase/GTP cyclohydrolase II n=1 Tax=Corynebacterium sp. PCR 32 TaxID=3351342 RepID=UPI0030B3CB83